MQSAPAYLHGIVGVSSCDATCSSIQIQSHLLVQYSKITFLSCDTSYDADTRQSILSPVGRASLQI